MDIIEYSRWNEAIRFYERVKRWTLERHSLSLSIFEAAVQKKQRAAEKKVAKAKPKVSRTFY